MLISKPCTMKKDQRVEIFFHKMIIGQTIDHSKCLTETHQTLGLEIFVVYVTNQSKYFLNSGSEVCSTRQPART